LLSVTWPPEDPELDAEAEVLLDALELLDELPQAARYMAAPALALVVRNLRRV
jgi:hypothetical protein